MTAEQENPQHFQMSDIYLDHLESLLVQEQKEPYKRSDYMSEEWQARLWEEEVNVTHKGVYPLACCPPPPPGSPRSVMDPTGTAFARSPPSQVAVTAQAREKVSEWMYQVIDRFDLDRDVVGIALFYLDKYLSTNYSTEPALQLAAMASIYLSVKLHSDEKIPIHVIPALGPVPPFTIHHVAAMELSIAQSLGWLLHPPTAAAFLVSLHPIIAECLRQSQDADLFSNVVDFARFMSELSVCDYSIIDSKPSSIAIASILSGMEYYRLPRDTLDLFVMLATKASLKLDYDEAEVLKCSQKLKLIYEVAMPNDPAAWG